MVDCQKPDSRVALNYYILTCTPVPRCAMVISLVFVRHSCMHKYQAVLKASTFEEVHCFLFSSRIDWGLFSAMITLLAKFQG